MSILLALEKQALAELISPVMKTQNLVHFVKIESSGDSSKILMIEDPNIYFFFFLALERF
jgi:hypothetical protein